MKKVITSYSNPDLDGVSCMYAYAELLHKKDIECEYFIYGTVKREVSIVCDMFDIKLNPVKEWEKGSKAILVDLNNVSRVNFIKPEDVIEVIDHHTKIIESNDCVNAKMQIEKLGAAATLVAERFKKENISISRESAILLFYGIISNSINLKVSMTSLKDIDMEKWLKSQCNEISEEKIKEIFEEKSKIDEANLEKEMEIGNCFSVLDKSLTIGQMEIVDAEEFIKKHFNNIMQILKKLKDEKKVDYIYLNVIDIIKGETILITIDDSDEEYIKKVLDIDFKNHCGTIKLTQRKEIVNTLCSKIGEIKKRD